jgi:hypothetical protein
MLEKLLILFCCVLGILETLYCQIEEAIITFVKDVTHLPVRCACCGNLTTERCSHPETGETVCPACYRKACEDIDQAASEGLLSA